MPITGKHVIGFNRSANGTAPMSAVNPATGDRLPQVFLEATPEEIERAATLAQTAFQSYRRLGGTAKAAFLAAVADEIMALGDELVERAVLETALPPVRIQSERGRTVGQLRLFADLVREGSWCEATIDTAIADRQPLPRCDIRRMLVPMGPVVVFAASNFPLAFSAAGGDTASALAGGNPVIVKAHSSHMGTSELAASAVCTAARRTGMPDGVFSLLFGGGPTVGHALIEHPAVKAGAFTGSERAGRLLFDIAGRRRDPIPFFAEMGSINPVLLLPKALERRGREIAGDLAVSVTLGSGQFCTKPGLLIAIGGKALDALVRDLGGRMEKILPVAMLNARIHTGFLSGRETVLRQPGVDAVAAPAADPSVNGGQPTLAVVAAADFISNPVLLEEVFGPYTLLVRCQDAGELSRVIGVLGGQLTATVIAETEDLESFLPMIDQLKEKSGRMVFNGVPTGVEVCAAMQHGGPYPATTDARFTSVGTAAIKRFVRPISFQNWPQPLLPDELKAGNPLGIWRRIDGALTRD